MSFNPMASAGFNASFFIPPIADHTFKITGFRLRKQPMKDGVKAILDVQTRIENGNAETNNKSVNIQCILGSIDESTGDLTKDDDGNYIADLNTFAQISHAAFGYGNTAQDDVRFREERDGLDLDMDIKEMKVTGSGWDELKGCSFKSTVTHNQSGDRTYPKFNSIRPVG